MTTDADRARAAEAWAMLSGLFEASRLIPPMQRAAPGTLPLTVVSGFLGAGKTTLLNGLLLEPHGQRIAVLVNDFGRIAIDASLILSRHEDTIALTNGCACCSVAGDLTRTLVQLAQRPEPPDAIVLEASGLADPHGIAQVALANPALRLDGVLTVLDAETIAERAADPACRDTFMAQIMAADLLVLNKLDLLDATAQSAARRWLAATVPSRPVLDAVQAKVPAAVALGLNSPRMPTRPPARGHAAAFESWELTSPVPMDRAETQAMLAALPHGILRAKGFLQFADDPRSRTLYQRVGRRWTFSPSGAFDGAEPESALVVIAQAGAIDGEHVKQAWNDCRTTSA